MPIKEEQIILVIFHYLFLAKLLHNSRTPLHLNILTLAFCKRNYQNTSIFFIK